MGEKFRYYVPFLAYVAGVDHSFIVPGHDYYESNEPLETELQIERMHNWLNENAIGAYLLSPKTITALDWKRIQ